MPYVAPERARLWWAQRRLRGDRALEVVDRLVTPGDTVLDIGADWGFFTSRLSQLVGPTGHVHAFEPNPVTRANLDEIARREGNVSVHPVGLSDVRGEGKLHVPFAEGGAIDALGSLSPPRRRYAGVRYETVKVRLATLDAELGSDAPPVAFVKCDVEGHELAVLRGSEGTLLRSHPPLLLEVEERHNPDGFHATFELLERIGYAAWCVRPEGLRPIEEFDLNRDQRAFTGPHFQPGEMPPAYVNDFLFVRVGASVDELLASG